MYKEIKTERLLLRPLDIRDIETMYEYASDPENTKYMLYLPSLSKEESLVFLINAVNEWQKEQPSFYEFAIELNGRHIGAVSLYLDDNRTEAELGWILNKRYWNQGYVTEAALVLKEFAIKEQKIKKLVAHCDCRNVASYSVMEKIGLILERDDGVRKYKNSDEEVKEFMYSMLIK